MVPTDILFEEVIEYPDPSARERFARLVGLDDVKARLVKEARVLLNPDLLQQWSLQHHGQRIGLLRSFERRLPLFVLAGDVGTGKTELAETFGDAVAREDGISVTLHRLSLSTRGSGAVGEMTRLLAAAFKELSAEARKGVSRDGKPTSAVILLIDEADALAQSRELSQMHHEDRAGVNALIRGVDSLVHAHLPALVLMCTNRPDALDPAVRRRAAAVFSFKRPTEAQRLAVLRTALAGTNISETEIHELARLTGPTATRTYGATYSDLTQRLLPALLLDAFPNRPISFRQAEGAARAFLPTAPFIEASGEAPAP